MKIFTTADKIKVDFFTFEYLLSIFMGNERKKMLLV